MKFLSLFAGIGGLDLGLERAGWECVGQVERDEFCLEVLAKHWPEVKRFDDVRTVTAELVWKHCGNINAIVGGFPCQDVSVANPKGEGLDGARSGLWREYHRLVCEIRPRIVLIENVANLVVRGLDVVLCDLAACGYDAEWQIISAASVGARHLRERLFIVAYPNSQRRQGRGQKEIFGEQVLPWRENSGSVEDWLRRSHLHQPKLLGSLNGVSRGVDRLRALGNAVVPQVSELIGRAILQMEAA